MMLSSYRIAAQFICFILHPVSKPLMIECKLSAVLPLYKA